MNENRKKSTLFIKQFGIEVTFFYHSLKPGQISDAGVLNPPRGRPLFYRDLVDNQTWGGKGIFQCGGDYIFAMKHGYQFMLDAKVHFFSTDRRGNCEGVIDSEQIKSFIINNFEHDNWFFKTNFYMPCGRTIVEKNVGDRPAEYMCAFVSANGSYHVNRITAFYCDRDEVTLDLRATKHDILVSVNNFTVNGKKQDIMVPTVIDTSEPIHVSNISSQHGTFLRLSYEPAMLRSKWEKAYEPN